MEEKVFNAIVEYIKEHKYAPSVRELCDLTGLKSTSSVHRYIHNLIKKGKIESDHDFSTPRALRVAGYEFVKEGDWEGVDTK